MGKRKKKKKAKRNLSILIFFPAIYMAILKMYTKFEDCGSHENREICDKKLIGEKEKMDKQREWKAGGGWFSLTQYNLSYTTFEPNFKILAKVVPKKSLTEILLERKKKWTNKENDKQEEADSLLHDTTSHTQCLYKISKS